MTSNHQPLAPQVADALTLYAAAYHEGLISATELYHWSCAAVACNDHPETLDIAIALAE